MAEEKKRFPSWLLVLAVLALPWALSVGFIETVGREGTAIGQSERIKPGMSQAEVAEILRPSVLFCTQNLPTSTLVVPMALGGDGRFQLDVDFHPVDPPFDWKDVSVCAIRLDARKVEKGEYFALPWWRVRRWAEQAYTAIHGPRR